MNKKRGLIVVFSLFIVVASICIPLMYVKGDFWNYCRISAYVTNLDDYSTSSTNTQRYQFTITEPPAGSNITNTIEVRHDDSGQNYTKSLSIGDVVYLDYQYLNVSENRVIQATEPDHFMVFYEGEVFNISINTILIPEFPPIFVIPIFMTATLLVIMYRKKYTT